MGIPLFFKKITDEYGHIIIDTKEISNVNRLFLDLNCAIHPCCRRITEENYDSKCKGKYELRMFNEIISYIKLIVDLVKPDVLLYIAIDGVAPKAKMAQQRLRRFKTIKDRDTKNKIKNELNIPNSTDFWDTNAITPGTEFMNSLSNRIKLEIKKKTFITNKIIFSDSSVYGEGEHKIFNYIKNTNNESIDVVYGLDADLIMLSLSSRKNNIFLLREALEFGKSYYESCYKFLYLEIDSLKQSLISEVISNISNNTNFNNDILSNFVDDFVVLCYLIGNDFLPHLICIDLRHNGLDIIIEKYIHTYLELGEFLVIREKNKINTNFFRSLINKLSELEDTQLKKISKFRNRFSIRNKNYDNEYDRRTDLIHNKPMLNKKEEQYINIGEENWRQRYYHKCFDISSIAEINDICLNYMEGIKWVFNYYFNECISWQWCYRYNHGPTLYDLCNFLKNTNDIDGIKISKGKPNKPFYQLISVLPPNSCSLLPTSYQKLVTNIESPIIEYFPIDYEYDMYFKRYFWQCPPILPYINDIKLKQVLDKIKLTNLEKTRNSFGENFELEFNSGIKII